MSTLVKSLKRLYEKGSSVVTLDKLKSMVEEGKITEDEYYYITGEEYES